MVWQKLKGRLQVAKKAVRLDYFLSGYGRFRFNKLVLSSH